MKSTVVTGAFIFDPRHGPRFCLKYADLIEGSPSWYRFIFITGAERCGTNLVGALIDGHSQLDVLAGEYTDFLGALNTTWVQIPRARRERPM